MKRRPELRRTPPPADMARNLPLGDLLALGAQLSAETEPEALLQEVADAIHSVLGHDQVYIRLRNADTDELEAVAFAGLPDTEIERLRVRPTAPAFYQNLLQSRYQRGESFLIPAGLSVEHEPTPQTLSHAGVLLVPLRGRGDRLIGMVYIVPTPPEHALADIQRIEVLTRQASLALENARLAARTARLLAKEQLLAELGRDVSTTLDLHDILTRTVARLQVAFQGGTVVLRNEQDGLEIVAAIGDIDATARQVRLRVGEGICGWVVQHGMPFLSNDITSERRLTPAASDVGTNRLIRSYISVPLRSGGLVIGALNVAAHQSQAFTYEDVDLLEAVAAQVGGPIGSARLYQEAQRLTRQLARRNEQLTVLNAIARTAVVSLDLERVLTLVTQQMQQGFGYGHVELHLVNEAGDELLLAARAGDRDYPGASERAAQVLTQALTDIRTIRIDDVHADQTCPKQGITRAQLCVPVARGRRVLAVINLESEQVGAFTAEDVSVLETVADVLASAIGNAHLSQRAQEAAVLEERSRLARDLHDSVSQQLFSMTLTAQAARAQLDKNPQRSASQLERLQETASAALSEMRALIFQLRPPALAEQGLKEALQHHISVLSRREHLTMHYHAEGDDRHARGIEQPLFRITQEALNNVVRHARASSVEVTIDLQPDVIVLRIRDDGCGFDVRQHSGGQHLGMTSMHERASEIGATLTLRSQPGHGTEIEVVIAGRTAHAPTI